MTTGETISSRRAVVLGFSLLYAVAVVYYYFTWLIPYEGAVASGYTNALNIAMCASAVAVALVIRYAQLHARMLIASTGSLFFAAAVIVQLATTSALSASSALSLAIGTGAGIGIGLLMPLWFEAIAAFPGKLRAYACGIMAFGGMALGMVVELLPHPFLECTCLLLLAASTVLYATNVLREGRSAHEHEDKAAEQPAQDQTTRSIASVLGTFTVPLVCALSMSIVYGMIDATVVHATIEPSIIVFISQFGGLIAGAIFLLHIRLSKAPASTALINAIFGVVATGLLLLPFLPEPYGIALNLIAATGWKLALLVLFILVVEYFAEQPKRLLPWIAAAYALPRFGLLIGGNLPLLFPVEEGYTFVRLAAVAFFLLYLILMTVWLINARARRIAERKAEELSQYREDPKRAIRAKAEKLAEVRGLTKRETEVMMLLAEGRDLAFICNQCYLSRNTVKSYTKSIYLKLAVHSKQELIDLVDRT